MYLDWDFANANTVLFALGFGFLFIGQQLYQRVPVNGLRMILAGPFWLIGGAIVLISVLELVWHMIGPIVEWIFSFL